MKIKIICDRNFFEFVSCNKINDVEVMTIESLTNYKKIYAAIADTNLLFIVTDELKNIKWGNLFGNMQLTIVSLLF